MCNHSEKCSKCQKCHKCHKCYKCNKCHKSDKCERLLYSVGAWADNRVTEIKFIPKGGIPISWTTINNTLNQSNPTNSNHWNMQSPITSSQFPILPLKINCGDKFLFTFNNDTGSPNAFACAANIDGIIYRTVNNTISSYPNKIVLTPDIGFNIINPLYNPTTDLATRNIVDTVNYISVSPNNTNDYTLIWYI
jgi:hypothetical protein